jgi:hypothetical protein
MSCSVEKLLCGCCYYVVELSSRTWHIHSYALSRGFCSHHVGLDWQKYGAFAHTTLAWIGKILSWKLKAYALMPNKMAMILSWEFYSDWYHMHDESSLIWVAFYVVIELHFMLLLSCILRCYWVWYLSWCAVTECMIWLGWLTCKFT